MKSSLTHHDLRSGDTYVVTLDTSGDFVFAHRYIDRIGFNPVTYDDLAEVPQPQRNVIEEAIHENKTNT